MKKFGNEKWNGNREEMERKWNGKFMKKFVGCKVEWKQSGNGKKIELKFIVYKTFLRASCTLLCSCADVCGTQTLLSGFI